MIKLISATDKLSHCHAMLCLCVMATNGNSLFLNNVTLSTRAIHIAATVRRLLYKSDFLPALLKLLQPEGKHCEIGVSMV